MIEINNLIKKAMKSKNQTELKAYRNIKSEFLIAETAKNAEALDEARQISILKKYAGKLEKSILDFSEAGREDLVAEYRDELEVVKKLLPEPVNESQICLELCQWAEYKGYGFELSTDNPIHIPKKDMGIAIRHLKEMFPQADGKMISEIVKKYVV